MRKRALPANLGLKLFCGAVAVLLVAPTLIVIPMSFSSVSTFEFPPPDWSTQWYARFFEDPAWYESAWLSIRVAIVVAVVATVLGTIASFALVRGRGWWREPGRALLVAPLIVPGVILAVAIYPVFLQWHLTETFAGFVFAHTVVAMPLVLIPLSTALASLDPQMEKAAASLGASPLTTLWRVTLPLIRPSMLTAALFAFLISFDEAIVSLFLSGPTARTLPVQLYRSITIDINPTIAASSTMMIAISTTLLLVAGALSARKMQRS
jgi:putative spermidine/putrescine transport system permease protein